MNFDNLFVRYGEHHIVFNHPHCPECKKNIEDGILFGNKCGGCYDNEYSECYDEGYQEK